MMSNPDTKPNVYKYPYLSPTHDMPKKKEGWGRQKVDKSLPKPGERKKMPGKWGF